MGAPWTDARMEEAVGRILRMGVILAAVTIAFGGLLYLRQHGGETPHYAIFRGEPATLRSPGGILQDAAAGDGRGMIQLGLLVLLATPVARVVFSIWAFLRVRDRFYAMIAAVVLLVLCVGIFGST